MIQALVIMVALAAAFIWMYILRNQVLATKFASAITMMPRLTHVTPRTYPLAPRGTRG